MRKIIRNIIKCNHCGDVIESKSCYDFVMCKCRCCFVDGGQDFLRRGYTNSEDDFEELSIFGPEEE